MLISGLALGREQNCKAPTRTIPRRRSAEVLDFRRFGEAFSNLELYYLYGGEASISRETMERGNSSIKVKFIKILKT